MQWIYCLTILIYLFPSWFTEINAIIYNNPSYTNYARMIYDQTNKRLIVGAKYVFNNLDVSWIILTNCLD